MQDIVFYAAVNETQGIVRDSANARNQSAPVLVLGVSACLKMRLFAACNVATPYPVASLSGISAWNWRMDADFERNTPSKLVADAEDIFVHTVTDSVDGETVSFTEFVIPISEMNTQELATWLGNEKKRSGLIGELVGYDIHENAVFVLQIEDFTIRNRIAGLGDPTAIEQEVATRSQTAQMIQAAVSSSAAIKQDKLTSANAGTNIAIDENGIISNTYSLPSATTGSKGGVMLATAAETISGSNATKAISPATFVSALSGNNPIIAKSAIQAFQSITELGSASTATLKSGGVYRLSAVSGNHYLTVPDVPADEFGTDAHLELFVGDTSLIHVSEPLILMDVLIPNAVNDCVIRFRDGTARMFVEGHAYGYVVTVSGGTAGTQLGGSLYYGLSESTAGYVTFTNAMNGSACDLGGATTNGEKHIVGNGYTETVISGGISCTSKTTFSNLGMNGVSVLNGTMTLGDVYIPSDATVSVSGGGLTIEKVTGDGGVIDLGGTNVYVSSGSSAYASGCTFSGGRAPAGSNGGGAVVIGVARFQNCTFEDNLTTANGGCFYETGANAILVLDGCTVSNASATNGGAIYKTGGSIQLTSTLFTDVIAANGIIYLAGGNLTVSGCTVSGCTVSNNNGHFMYLNGPGELVSCLIDNNVQSTGSGGRSVHIGAVAVTLTGNTIIAPAGTSTHAIFVTSGGTAILTGSNTFDDIAGSSGAVVISSGASINLTSSIAPGGGVTFATGGATIIPGGSSAMAYTLGGMTVPQIGNTNVVNLNSTNVVISSGTTASASGCTITGGYIGTQGGAFDVNGSLVLSGCIVSGNSAASQSTGGALVIRNGGNVTLFDCSVVGNNGATVGRDINVSSASITISGGTIGYLGVRDGSVVGLAGNIDLTNIVNYVSTSTGKVIISSGASINLTGSIAPGGGITLSGGAYSDPTTIFYSSGGVSDSRTFSELDIKGSTINSMGLIYGATVYSNEGDDHEVSYTEDGGATSSSVTVTGATTFVVPGGLMKVSNT